MMRKLFFGLLTAMTLAACSSDPVYHGMSPQQKEDYSKAVAGEYTGTYIIIYNDGRSDAKAIKVENSLMTITDQMMHSVCFHNYPVSQLSSLDAGKPFANQSVFQFAVVGIYEGHTLLQAFDDWQDNAPEYLTYFQLD